MAGLVEGQGAAVQRFQYGSFPPDGPSPAVERRQFGLDPLAHAGSERKAA